MHQVLYRICSLVLISLISLTASAAALAQSVETAPPMTKAASNKPAIEILEFKVGSDYYPMLEEKSAVIGADSSDYPRTEGEKLARRNGRRTPFDKVEDVREQGRLRTRVKVISDASWVKFVFRNTGDKPIRTIDWDFAFPRFEDGKVALRQAVSSQVAIKPGEKKGLKQQLPPGASKCKVINVSVEEVGNNKGKVFDSVCGQGIHDASQLKQETISIKRIGYADGSVWQK